GHVKLVWRTESEIENAYWFVQKKTPNSDFVSIATIDGQGSKTSSTDYQYVDTDVKPGDSVSYRLADIAYNGDITYHPEKSLRLKVPERFELLANYPNPFNPSTTISYKLPKQSRVQLTIYNVLGQKVRELVRGELQGAGVQKVFWDSRNDAGSTVSTGIYIYRLQIGNFNTSRKMILMK
ncbi:T9SS type A sorting domain-containing protein, partial [bacterium]|nr:T9SS type A sorting domain-containing protein [bacterium]